ncbi:MAG: hypothetical protein WA116_04580 [Anaerolineaceae bacterium]
MKAEFGSALTLIVSIFFLVVLIVCVIILIVRTRKRRKNYDTESQSSNNYPFPQRRERTSPQLLPAATSGEELDTKIRLAYGDWLSKYMLPDMELGREFLRSNVEKHWLRYQVTANSFEQGLAMLISVLMAGDDQSAQLRFDRLLAFCLAHPSAGSPDLVSWSIMPDVAASKRLDPDFHSETWISFALLAALKQWGTSERFHYDVILCQRLDAMLKLSEASDGSETDRFTGVFPPFFFDVFAKTTGDAHWLDMSRKLEKGAQEILESDTALLMGDGSAEDARLALLVLQLGLTGIWQEKSSWKRWSGKVEPIVRTAAAELPAKINSFGSGAGNEMGGFSPLSLLACSVPAAICLADQELIDSLWKTLVRAETDKHDSRGASLRLLAMYILSGNTWFSQVNWQELPAHTKPQETE